MSARIEPHTHSGWGRMPFSTLATPRWVELGVGAGVSWQAVFRNSDAAHDRAGADAEQCRDASRRRASIAHGGVAHQGPGSNDDSPTSVGRDRGDLPAELRRYVRDDSTDEGFGIDRCGGPEMLGLAMRG